MDIDRDLSEKFRYAKYSLLAICEPTLIIFTILFFKLRKRYIIRFRCPELVYIGNLWIIFLIPGVLSEDLPCWVGNIFRMMMIPVLGNGILLRCWFTLKRFEEQQNLSNEVKNNMEISISQIQDKLSFSKRLFAGRSMVLAYLFLGSILLTALIGFSFLAPDFWSPTLVRNSYGTVCGIGETRLFNSGVCLIYGIISILAAIKMRKVKENLGIKTEMKVIGIGAAIVATASVISTFIVVDLRLRMNVLLIATVIVHMLAFMSFTMIPVIKARNLDDVNADSATPLQTDSGIESATSLEMKADTLSLQFVLQDEGMLTEYRKFLKLEFCSENLAFIEAVNRFKKLREEDLKNGAQRIVRIFIGVGSRQPINVSGEVIAEIERKMSIEETSPKDWRKLFDEAYCQIFHLLKHDSFPRFIQSINFSQA